MQVYVGVKQPFNWQFSATPVVDLAWAESVAVLEERGHIVVLDNLWEECTVDVVTLQGLVLIPSSKDVTTCVQPAILDPSKPGLIFEVANGEPTFEAEFVVDVLVDEEVAERFVERHENDPVVAGGKWFDFLDAKLVYVEASNSQPHSLAKVPQ